jgi:hypothetical protein
VARPTLQQHLNRELRAGHLVVFGFSERLGKRVLINSPWREIFFKDVGDAQDSTDRYTDVLFYEQTEIVPQSEAEAVVELPSPAKTDPRVKRDEMIYGLEKALAKGWLIKGRRVSLKEARSIMLKALEHEEPPRGMGDDSFNAHCRDWLRDKGICP